MERLLEGDFPYWKTSFMFHLWLQRLRFEVSFTGESLLEKFWVIDAVDSVDDKGKKEKKDFEIVVEGEGNDTRGN